jgi:hypothetical protein
VRAVKDINKDLGVFEDDDNISICPLHDKKMHLAFDDQCECEPFVEILGDHLLFIHNSFDFREIAEELNDQKD